ncbi:MAG: GNAT family N-acetyltransferase [Coriobacteriia bacterium]|nr:GNAT family N-acetyltransferase [Coriobacteriia bacterium]
MEIEYNGFIISDDKDKLQVHRIREMLAESYWAKSRTEDVIKLSFEHALCFGVYYQEKQVGFARCLTDYATMYWLGDVIIDDAYRGLGLGKALVEAAVGHESIRGLKGRLETNDAHGLYERFGFRAVEGKYMVKRETDSGIFE